MGISCSFAKYHPKNLVIPDRGNAKIPNLIISENIKSNKNILIGFINLSNSPNYNLDILELNTEIEKLKKTNVIIVGNVDNYNKQIILYNSLQKHGYKFITYNPKNITGFLIASKKEYNSNTFIKLGMKSFYLDISIKFPDNFIQIKCIKNPDWRDNNYIMPYIDSITASQNNIIWWLDIPEYLYPNAESNNTYKIYENSINYKKFILLSSNKHIIKNEKLNIIEINKKT